MNDQELKQLFKEATPYLSDNGFTNEVMVSLPPTRGLRAKVLFFALIASLIIGFGIWVISSTTLPFQPLQLSLILSPASLIFWSCLGLFGFLTLREDIFEAL